MSQKKSLKQTKQFNNPIILGSNIKAQVFSLLFKNPIIYLVDYPVRPFDFEFVDNKYAKLLFNAEEFNGKYFKLDIWRKIFFANCLSNRIKQVRDVVVLDSSIEVVHDYYDEIINYNELYIFNDHQAIVGYNIYDLFETDKKYDDNDEIIRISDNFFYTKRYVPRNEINFFDHSETIVKLCIENIFNKFGIKIKHKNRYIKEKFLKEREFNVHLDNIINELYKVGIQNDTLLKLFGRF